MNTNKNRHGTQFNRAKRFHQIHLPPWVGALPRAFIYRVFLRSKDFTTVFMTGEGGTHKV